MESRGRPILKTSMCSSRFPQKVFCGFCKRNGETQRVYESHTTKDANEKVICPILRNHKCELCGATGEDAHTRSHCPFAALGRTDPFFKDMLSPADTPPMDSFYNMVSLKKTRINSMGKRRTFKP